MPIDRRKRSRFPPTRWSLVGRAAGSDEPARQQALADLLAIYTPALRAFLVEARRVPAGLADDLVQGFVADKVLGRKIFRYANQGKGRFRNYLLKALNNYATASTTSVSMRDWRSLDLRQRPLRKRRLRPNPFQCRPRLK